MDFLYKVFKYLCLADNISKWPTVHNSGIDGEHKDTACVQSTIVRHGYQEVTRLHGNKIQARICIIVLNKALCIGNLNIPPLILKW